MYDVCTKITEINADNKEPVHVLTIIGCQDQKEVTRVNMVTGGVIAFANKEQENLWLTFWENMKKVGENANMNLHTEKKVDMGDYWLAFTTNRCVGAKFVPFSGVYLVEKQNGKIYDFNHNFLIEE